MPFALRGLVFVTRNLSSRCEWCAGHAGSVILTYWSDMIQSCFTGENHLANLTSYCIYLSPS